jgi:predicted nucleic acid-binding protein
VLVDTSVWISHFRRRDGVLVELLESDRVMIHPMVVGELACGMPPERTRTLHDIGLLRLVQEASWEEISTFLEHKKLYGSGCGLIDMALLASCLITPDCELWTQDRPLAALARRFGVAHEHPVLQ